MRYTIRRGRRFAPDAALQGAAPERRVTTRVALLGSDCRGLRPALLVAEGDQVARGQALFSDRRQERLHFTSPVSGTIVAITRGERRSLDSLVIEVGGDAVRQFSPPAPGRAGMQALLLESGLWQAFRTRPFERIPDPNAAPPAAIFVTAIDTAPLAPDPRSIIEASHEAFERGVLALCLLTDGAVHLCQAPGTPLVTPTTQIQVAEFDGPHPAGLPGTHIHFILPASARRMVWHVGYQDVIALGMLLATGDLTGERVVSIGGDAVNSPRLLRTFQGADLRQLAADDMTSGAIRVVSGPAIGGREARFLGRYHRQVSVLAVPEQRQRPAWLATLGDRAILPLPAYDQVMPLGLLAIPLLRALAAGDVETAERLGCLELGEDDMALLSHVCPTGGDYGPMLRFALDELEAAA